VTGVHESLIAPGLLGAPADKDVPVHLPVSNAIAHIFCAARRWSFHSTVRDYARELSLQDVAPTTLVVAHSPVPYGWPSGSAPLFAAPAPPVDLTVGLL
jgi:hypothetical protein